MIESSPRQISAHKNFRLVINPGHFGESNLSSSIDFKYRYAGIQRSISMGDWLLVDLSQSDNQLESQAAVDNLRKIVNDAKSKNAKLAICLKWRDHITLQKEGLKSSFDKVLFVEAQVKKHFKAFEFSQSSQF